MHASWIPTGDTLRKAYHEECQQIGDDTFWSQKLDNRGSEKNHGIATVINDAESRKKLSEIAVAEAHEHTQKATESLGHCFQLVPTRHRNRRFSMCCVAVATTPHHSHTLCCVTRVSIAIRRCEVIRIGDRDYAGQIASSMPMRTPMSGGYIVNSPGP